MNETQNSLLQIVTKAKKSCTAYEKPSEYSGHGRSHKKENSIRLNSYFSIKKNSFKKATVKIYGKEEELSYYCINLLWGTKIVSRIAFCDCSATE